MHQRRAGLVLGVGLVVASCGGSSTEPEDTLTAAEALALLEVAMGQGLELAGDMDPAMTTLPGGRTQVTVPCAMGGTAAVSAQFSPVGDMDSDNVGVAVAVTLVHSGCIERHEMSGITFTLDGAPEVEMTVELSISPEFLFDISGTVDGTVRWATGDGRSGTCALDVDLDTVNDASGFPTITLAGRACGFDVMESMPGLGMMMG